MAQVKDPVCGMTIDRAKAAGQSSFDGSPIFFCSTDCKAKFDAEPARYMKRS